MEFLLHKLLFDDIEKETGNDGWKVLGTDRNSREVVFIVPMPHEIEGQMTICYRCDVHASDYNKN